MTFLYFQPKPRADAHNDMSYKNNKYKEKKMKKVKNLFLRLIAVFAVFTVLPAYGAEETAMAEETATMEVLLGFSHDSEGVTFQVESSGCISKENFDLTVEEGPTPTAPTPDDGEGPPILPFVETPTPIRQREHTVVLKRIDTEGEFACNVWMPYGEKFTYTYEEMGLSEGEEFSVSNPLKDVMRVVNESR